MKARLEEPISGVFLSPLARAAQVDQGWGGRVMAAFSAVAQVFWTDFFWMAIAAVFVSHAWDWVLGRELAKLRDEFDEAKSRLGLYSKLSSFVIILLVRFIEQGFALQGWADTRGLISAGIAAGIVVQDIKSIEDKREKKIPLLGSFLAWVEGTLRRQLPAPKDEGGP